MSDGVSLIRHVLINNSTVTGLIPAAKIRPGPIPQDLALPAISIMRVDGIPTKTVSMKYPITFRDRIQVTTLAHTYTLPKSLSNLFLTALNMHSFTVLFSNGSYYCDSIIPDIIGPDFFDHDTLTFSQSVDFFVKYRSS